MSPVLLGIFGFILLLLCLAAGIEIAFGMGLVGFIGFWVIVSGPAALIKLATVPFYVASKVDLVALPLFFLMAHVTFASGLSRDLFNVASKWLGHLPGGMAIASIGGCAGFSAVSASSLATATTMGLVALPEMKKHQYSPALATGAIAAGGTMGGLIPPSGMLIIYGILTEESIAKLFIGGLIPGLMEALLYIITIYFLCFFKPSLGPRGPRYSFAEKMASLKNCGEVILLILLVIGGILLGWFTPTEAGAVGAAGAIGASCIRKRLTWEGFRNALTETLKSTGMIYGIMIGAFVFNNFVAASTIPMEMASTIGGLEIPSFFILLLILGTYFFLGMFLDPASMQVLTIPIYFPLIIGLGYHPLWFGIIVTRAMEISAITPPVGMNVYVVGGVADGIPMETIFKGIIPFLMADIFHVILLFIFPQLVTFLPSIFG